MENEMDDKIYYCGVCATRTEFEGKLPLRMGELVCGYCRLCGVASPLVGYITTDEAAGLGIRVPTLEELSAEH